MSKHDVVFIADRVKNHATATLESRDLEKLADEYFMKVYKELQKIASRVTHYSSPKSFIEHISKHKDSVVLSLWSGDRFRSRRAIIPSICEAYGIAYVGADPYIQTISSDKHLSKILCEPYKIATPKDVVISSEYEFPMLKGLSFPIVVKPNFEGGSIGIFSENLADTYADALKICRKLLPHYSQLIAEEYISGEEVSVCIAGINSHIDVFQAIRTSVNGKTYFEHEIFGAEIKKMERATRKREIITNRFPLDEKEKILTFFNALGKVEVIRVDGRLNGDQFTMIELTPDCSLSETSSMSVSFSAEGYHYEEMLKLLCENAIIRREMEYQNANR